MTAVLDLSGAPDIGLSGWLVPLRSGVVRDPSRAVRLPDKPGDVLAIGRSARLSSRCTPQRTVTVTALVLDDDRTPPQVSGDHAEIELVEEGAWFLRHNSKTAGSFINEGPPLLATNSPGIGPRLLQHGDKLRFGGGIRGTGHTATASFSLEVEEPYKQQPAEQQPEASTTAGRQVDNAAERRDPRGARKGEGGAPGHQAGRGCRAARSKPPRWQCPRAAPAASQGVPDRFGAQWLTGPLGAHRVLELAASTVADLTVFDHTGGDVLRGDGAAAADRGRAL